MDENQEALYARLASEIDDGGEKFEKAARYVLATIGVVKGKLVRKGSFEEEGVQYILYEDTEDRKEYRLEDPGLSLEKELWMGREIEKILAMEEGSRK